MIKTIVQVKNSNKFIQNIKKKKLKLYLILVILVIYFDLLF
jgi:hypothetical protein